MRPSTSTICFFISAAVTALPLSHIGLDEQLHNSRTGISLKARSQAGITSGEGGSTKEPDWTARLHLGERETYERLKKTHDRWKRTDPELWSSFQECENRIPAGTAPTERLWLVHQCTINVVSLAIKRTGDHIARLDEEMKRMPAWKDRQQKSVEESSPQNGTPKNDEKEGHENRIGESSQNIPGNNLFSKLNFHLNVPANIPFSKIRSKPSSSLQPVNFLPLGRLRPKFYIP